MTEMSAAKWQKEMKYNKFLPYYDEMCREADEQLAAIKSGLGHSILYREVRPALIHWACELDKYVYLHGRRFTKDDHVLFVKIFYDLVLMPGLEFRVVKTFAQILSNLLFKQELLSRDDLELPWRPLYELYNFVSYKNLEEDGLMLLPKDICKALETLIERTRTYFPVSATREILTEFRPLLCPWDMSFMKACTCLGLFLPSMLPPSCHQHGFKLWLDEVLYWVLHVQNGPPWESSLFDLLSRLACDNIGYVDFNPYMSDIFTRLMRGFKLSVASGRGAEQIEIGFTDKVTNAGSLCRLVVSCMGNETSVQSHITQLFQALESYVHPSNYGKWQSNILNFMQHLAHAMCQRVHRERYRKPDWRNSIPDNYKLTNKQIDEFVSSLLPCAINGMFAKQRSDLAVTCIRYLSHLSPHLVVPAVLDHMYPALQTLIEPHRLTQTLKTMVAVIIPMLRTSNGGGESLRRHAIPLMTAVLPGLDPNDVQKSMLTMQALGLFTVLIPIVDCSDAIMCRTDLTEEEKDICSATAMFDTYVNLYMDKVFSIIETFGCAGGAASQISRRRDSVVKFTPEESLIKGGIYASFRTLLANCSSVIYNLVVDRLFGFINENMLEGRITAEILGELCFSAVRTNPCEVFGRFLALLSKKLHEIIQEEHFNTEEEDCNVLWYLSMCTQIVRCEGSVLTRHKNDILNLLKLLALLKAKGIYEKVAQFIENLALSLSFLYVCEHENSRLLLDKPFEEYLPIRHWAEWCDITDLKVKWYIPNESEVEFLRELQQCYLFGELENLDKNMKNMKKDDILKSLSFIRACFSGSAGLLPLLEGKELPFIKSSVQMSKFAYLIAPKNNLLALDYHGKNIRNHCYEKMHKLMEFLLTTREDETKCLSQICYMYYLLLFHRGLHKTKFDNQSRGLALSKAYTMNSVVGSKSYIKSIVYELITIRHHKRLMEKSGYCVTDTHLAIAKDLLLLSTSNYSEVRREAQNVFDHFLINFPYSYRFVLDDILAFLKNDSSITHEQFKGSLYILIGNSKSRSLLTRHHWKTLIKIWPAIINAQHSEKPSVIALLESAQNLVVENIQSFQIKLSFNENPLQLAKLLWNQGYRPSLPIPSDQDIVHAANDEIARNEKFEKQYYQLISILVELSNDKTLHWRHLDMAQSFLSLLIRFDMRFSAEAIKVFVRLLINDSIKTRKMSIGLLAAVLKMHREKSSKSIISVQELMSLSGKNAIARDHVIMSTQNFPFKWGFRQDNDFLIYNANNLPKSKAEWDQCVFMDKTHHGFYCWPETVKILNPSNEQPNCDRSRDKLKPDELSLFDALLDQHYVDQLCEFMSLEDKSDENFHSSHYMFFQGLFRTYGDSVLAHFKPVIEKLVKSTKESEQRFASEFISGVIGGAKLWPYEKHVTLWQWLTTVLNTAFDSITSETFREWGTCVATVFDSRDARKLHWFVEILLELVKKPIDGSFNAASRLFLLQGGINQQEWRALPIWHELLEIVKPILAQPYQNLRDRLGSVLSTIFWYDISNVTNEGFIGPPNRRQFLDSIYVQLSILHKELTIGHPDDANSGTITQPQDNPERKEAILILKTLLCYFNTQWSHAFESVPLEVVKFLPFLCYFENETSDEELKRDCHWQLMQGFARTILTSHVLDALLAQCQEVSKNKWWKTRVSLLKFLQVSLFSNLFFYNKPERKTVVKQLILELMKDEQLDVREAASEALSGVLHCSYFLVDEELLVILRSWIKSPHPNVKHAGVLGLSAVVKSCPYTVPGFLPDVLMVMCPYATAPNPLGATVKKTFQDFKRTHQDSWHEHKERFTDDQLCILTDLLVSPNYYV